MGGFNKPMKYKLKRATPFREAGEMATVYGENSDYTNVYFENTDQRGWQSDCFPTTTFSDWFEEVDERWKPDEGKAFYRIIIDTLTYIEEEKWNTKEHYCLWKEEILKQGLVFRTRELAERAAEQIKALLKEFHKNNP